MKSLTLIGFFLAGAGLLCFGIHFGRLKSIIIGIGCILISSYLLFLDNSGK
ncbi:MAG: hypothetical protein ACN4GG_03625 [Akkermansiaceae bacterium]